MFRNIYLAVASCVALVAFMGFSASALADHVFDSDCAPDHEFAVTDFNINTTDSNISYKVSGISGTGLTCGSRIHDWDAKGGYLGVETLNDIAVIQNAPGVLVHAAPSADLPKGTFLGEAQVDALTWIGGTAVPVSDSELTLRVEDRDDPITPPDGVLWGSPDCPADALACYRGKSDTGHGWTWVEEDADGSTTLTIGRFYNHATGEPAGLTEIDIFSLCGYAGTTKGTECGDGSDPSKWVQKNGAPSDSHLIGRGDDKDNRLTDSIGIALLPPCFKGTGTYTVTVTNRGDPLADPPIPPQTTDPVSACVEWSLFRVPSIG